MEARALDEMQVHVRVAVLDLPLADPPDYRNSEDAGDLRIPEDPDD